MMYIVTMTMVMVLIIVITMVNNDHDLLYYRAFSKSSNWLSKWLFGSTSARAYA